ncbi:MAG: HEAT repeat domain-containing protein [Candidatus Binataceae bacterium]
MLKLGLVLALAMSLLAAFTVAAYAERHNRAPDSSAKVAKLVRELQGSNLDRREAATDALLKIRPMTPKELAIVARAMKNPDDAVRELAIQVLANAGPNAIPALEHAIDDDDQNIRGQALGALGGMARPPVHWSHPHGPGRVAEIGAPPNQAWVIWPILIRAFANDHNDVRKQAPLQFHWSEAAAMPLLLRALKDSNPEIRLGDAKAIDQVGNVYPPGAIRLNMKGAVPGLVALLRDPGRDVRNQALSTLVEIDPACKELLPILLRRLKDTDRSGACAHRRVEGYGRPSQEGRGSGPMGRSLLCRR